MDLEEQEHSGFRYAYSVYHAEYSRNPLFKSGARMEKLFDRTGSGWTSRGCAPWSLVGLKARPHHNRNYDLSAPHRQHFADPGIQAYKSVHHFTPSRRCSFEPREVG